MLEGKCHLHRCLEHCKRNLKGWMNGVVDKGTSETRETRLRDRGMADPFVKFMEFSASWCASAEEFSVVWRSLLDRLENDRCDTDWNEPNFAKYLRGHMLDCSGPLIRASWR